MLDRSSNWVRKWLRRYESHGIDGLYNSPRSGRPTTLDKNLESKFVMRIQNGATQRDGVTVLKGKNIMTFLADEFEAVYSLSGVYDLLESTEFSLLTTC